jgi:hypothetical protein
MLPLEPIIITNQPTKNSHFISLGVVETTDDGAILLTL